MESTRPLKKTASHAIFNLASVNSAKSRTKLMDTRKKKQLWPVILKKSNFWITLGIYGSSSLILKLAPPTPLPPYPTTTKKKKKKKRQEERKQSISTPKRIRSFAFKFSNNSRGHPERPIWSCDLPLFWRKGNDKVSKGSWLK